MNPMEDDIDVFPIGHLLKSTSKLGECMKVKSTRKRQNWSHWQKKRELLKQFFLRGNAHSRVFFS